MTETPEEENTSLSNRKPDNELGFRVGKRFDPTSVLIVILNHVLGIFIDVAPIYRILITNIIISMGFIFAGNVVLSFLKSRSRDLIMHYRFVDELFYITEFIGLIATLYYLIVCIRNDVKKQQLINKKIEERIENEENNK